MHSFRSKVPREPLRFRNEELGSGQASPIVTSNLLKAPHMKRTGVTMFDGASLDERILEAALDSLHEGVMLLDKAGRIMLVNEAATTIVGVPEKEVLRRHIGRVIPDSSLIEALGDR